jgi:Cys-tRNA synthase (O-phospho-L-seryl-tRNA:Cys-tRNA synthase)
MNFTDLETDFGAAVKAIAPASPIDLREVCIATRELMRGGRTTRDALAILTHADGAFPHLTDAQKAEVLRRLGVPA